jgi:hypothetical protein
MTGATVTTIDARLPISGGSDTAPNEAAVRGWVRLLIRCGHLPAFRSGELWAGRCRTPHECALCGVGIVVGEVEMEWVSPSGVGVIYAHRRCFEIWIQEAGDGDVQGSSTP